ncbi:MAG: hypothetical protein LBS53_11540 [Synergistaceae bacterium]|nr:hypothetical protein [Synergistaceae bacterium]
MITHDIQQAFDYGARAAVPEERGTSSISAVKRENMTIQRSASAAKII